MSIFFVVIRKFIVKIKFDRYISLIKKQKEPEMLRPFIIKYFFKTYCKPEETILKNSSA